MMDQNRCLLDVIDNPQLLQSFLESEASADNNNQSNVATITTAINPTTTFTTTTHSLSSNNNNNIISNNNNNSSDNDPSSLTIDELYSQQNTDIQDTSAVQYDTSFTRSFESNAHGSTSLGPEQLPVKDVNYNVQSSVTSESDVQNSTSSDSNIQQALFDPSNQQQDQLNQAQHQQTELSRVEGEDRLKVESISETKCTEFIDEANVISEFIDKSLLSGTSSDYSPYDKNSKGSQEPDVLNQDSNVSIQNLDLTEPKIESISKHDPDKQVDESNLGSFNQPQTFSEQQPNFVQSHLSDNQPDGQDTKSQSSFSSLGHKDDVEQSASNLDNNNHAQPSANLVTSNDASSTISIDANRIDPHSTDTTPKRIQVSVKQESSITTTSGNILPSSPSLTTQANPLSSFVVTTTTTTTTKTTAPTTKRAPQKRAPRSAKGKNAKTSNVPTTSHSSVTPMQQTTVQPQFTTPQQQQVLFQPNNNGGLRQPALMASSPMGQTMGGMPQQQRVIQIQTANGPMYFAIAPGPAMNNNPMMSNQPGMQSQQYPSQQICFQPNSNVMMNRPQMAQPGQQQQQQQQTRMSSEYIHSNSSTPTSQQSDRPGQFTPELQQTRCLTSPQSVTSPQQQIRLQSPVIQYGQQAQSNQIQTSMASQMPTVNGLNKNSPMQNQQQFATSQPGPIILQNRSTQGYSQQQQQQIISSQGNNIIVNGQQMIQSSQSHQPRLGTPMMAGQTLAISNQQNAQQQHIVLPTSQSMMMPRMSNQLILNRPLNSPGQLLPGQQQFIQIQTPNGPMLLALPTQSAAQPINNTMIDYNNQVQQQQPPQQQQQHQQKDVVDTAQATTAKHTPSTPSKTVTKSSNLDLADLLLDCGILPEERMAASQSPSSVKTSQSPSISQINSPMPTMPQISSPMSNMDTSSMPTNPSQQQIPSYAGQPLQQQPIRITIGPDGQMMMQPTVYGAIRPVLASTMGQAHLNTINPNNIIPSSSPMMTLNTSPSVPNNNESNSDNKKSTTKGKGTATKRSRSKKSDIDKFPTLKTPKIAQQQQMQQQQQQQQQQMQAVTVLPMTVLVTDQNKVIAGSDVKPNVAQIAGSGQQMSLAKIITPVMQTASLQPLVNSNIIQTSIPSTNMLASTLGQNQSNMNLGQNTQLVSADSGNSISTSNMSVQNSTSAVGTTSTLTTSSTSQMSSSGNVTMNLLPRTDKPGTVESNPHISSSLMPSLSLTVDTLKIEQNGLKTHDGQNQTIKGIQNTSGGLTATLVLQPTQAQINSQNQMNQAQQIARQVDIRAQSILNQMGADQNAALNPQTKQSFRSFEDACKRLLRYHVFDTQPVSEAQIKKVDEIFEAAAESLLSRKKAIYDKYRLIILKQSMKTVPSSEEVMLDQAFVNDEQTYLKKERELFSEFEAQVERSLALKQAETDSKLNLHKDDCAPDYFAFGNNSPKRNNQDVMDSAAHSRDVDDWLLTDKWDKSRYPSVPDSEAATAIESILNEELS